MREAKYGNLLEEDDEKGRMLQGPMGRGSPSHGNRMHSQATRPGLPSMCERRGRANPTRSFSLRAGLLRDDEPLRPSVTVRGFHRATRYSRADV